MAMVQELTPSLNDMSSRSEGAMKVLGFPNNHKPRDTRGCKRTKAEQKAAQAHALKTLSKIKAQFQNVSCLLHDSQACSRVSQACCCRGSQGKVECQLWPCHWEAGQQQH